MIYDVINDKALMEISGTMSVAMLRGILILEYSDHITLLYVLATGLFNTGIFILRHFK